MVVDRVPEGLFTRNAEDIQQWDDWFTAVGLTEKWQAVKDTIHDDTQRCAWATILELNRLDALDKKVSHDGKDVCQPQVSEVI